MRRYTDLPDQDIAATVAEHAAGPMPPAPDELEYGPTGGCCESCGTADEQCRDKNGCCNNCAHFARNT